MDEYNEDAMIRPGLAARALRISRQLVRDWYLRGRLERTDDGLVRFGDVIELEWETRNCDRPGTFRRKPQLISA